MQKNLGPPPTMAFSGAAIPAVSTVHASGPTIALTVTQSDMQSKKERALSRRSGRLRDLDAH
jgi:hypothetical protein